MIKSIYKRIIQRFRKSEDPTSPSNGLTSLTHQSVLQSATQMQQSQLTVGQQFSIGYNGYNLTTGLSCPVCSNTRLDHTICQRLSRLLTIRDLLKYINDVAGAAQVESAAKSLGITEKIDDLL